MEKGEQANNLREKISSFREQTNAAVMRRADKFYASILASPATVVILLVIVAAFFAQQGVTFQDQIDDDVEIFLPDGAESTKLLKQVITEWSTDIAIIYVQTPNAKNTEGFANPSMVNITDVSYLREMSWVEGDDENKGGTFTQSGIDEFKDDQGRKDGVLWIISPTQVIKEVNSADGRFNS